MPMTGTMSLGKIAASTPGNSAPSSVGPRAIPATTSPITRGWRRRTASHPNARATSITTAIGEEERGHGVGGLARACGGDGLGGPIASVSVRSVAVPATGADPPGTHCTRPARLPSL